MPFIPTHTRRDARRVVTELRRSIRRWRRNGTTVDVPLSIEQCTILHDEILYLRTMLSARSVIRIERPVITERQLTLLTSEVPGGE